MAKSNKLKPCPFGCDERSFSILNRFHDRGGLYYVFCHFCGCCGPEGGTSSGAAKLWNTRRKPKGVKRNGSK